MLTATLKTLLPAFVIRKFVCALFSALLFALALPAHATTTTDVPYIDAAGALAQTAPGVDVTVIDTDADITGLPTPGTLTTGWYVVTGSFTYAGGTITVSGDVNLILADNASLTVNGSASNAGINVSGANRLTVYAQSTGAAMGSLTATGGNYGAGIGGGNGGSGGAITIAGGTVNAAGGQTAAGGGGGRLAQGGSITIVGSANVTAIGGANGNSIVGGGAGIGSGGSGTATPFSAGAITINTAGTLAATGGASTNAVGSGAAIGEGGYHNVDGAEVLYLVTATAGPGGSIAPAGNVGYAPGSAPTVTIAPASGYAIASVTDNGADVTSLLAGNAYIVANIADNHTIEATFALTASPVATPVPALNETMLALLALMLAGMAGLRRKGRG
ncbi:MAG: IPTL-CTERM sorting domain-containing protein [Burkholderiales bacterium]|jgi:hypothetical protein|nr:IPTL-CTERM sorting domain-containing protein [Burkholderiales bacterium]